MSTSIRDVYGPANFSKIGIIVYLAIPAVLFLLGFIQPILAVPVAALIAGAFIRCLGNERRPGSDRHSDRQSLRAPVVAALVVACISGIATGLYNWDWIKHWALVNELARNPWPVVLDLDGVAGHLRFYIGAYIVPAFVHKLLPVIPASTALLAWFGIGYVLFFQVVSGAVAGRAAAAAAIILLLGGADFYAEHLCRLLRDLPSAPLLGIHYDSWPARGIGNWLEYSSILTALIWVPHQSVATFLVAGMLVSRCEPRFLGTIVLAFGLLAIWSPYGMIGLLPLMAVVGWRSVGRSLPSWPWLSLAAGVSFTLVVAFYLSSDLPGGVTTLHLTNGVIANLFLLVELAPFALILRANLVRDVSCLVSFGTLVLLPFVHGGAPDLVMRASMGPLFVLSLRSIQAMLDWRVLRWQRALQVAAIGLCAPGAVGEAVFNLTAGAAHRQFVAPDPLAGVASRTFVPRRDYTAKEFFDICGWRYAGQYFARTRPRLVTDRPP